MRSSPFPPAMFNVVEGIDLGPPNIRIVGEIEGHVEEGRRVE